MVKRLLISIIFLSLGMLLFGGASAADTLYGTIITAEGYENYIDYNDIAGNAKATVYGPTLEATVLAIYGLAGPGTPYDQVTDPAAAVYYSYSITNMGNTTDVYSLALGSITYGGVGNNSSYWTIQIVSAVDDTVISSRTIAEDGSAGFRVKVTPHSDAQSGWTATVPVAASTASYPAGAYTGANGTPYGGPALVNDTTVTTVRSGVMTLTRVATVDSPSNYHQTNDVHYPVPGSMVTATMSISNEGSATAEGCIMIDKVPAGHQAGHVNAFSNNIDNVSITAGQGSAMGWMVSYSTLETLTSSQRLVGSLEGWTILGTLETGTESWKADTLPYTATFIKWEKAGVEAGENGTLTWGYIIR